MRLLELHALLPFALAAAVAPLGAAQSKADATLYTRIEDGVVRAAIEIEIEHGWHLYHGPTKADLGHPEAVGMPTVVTLGGAGITWGEVVFPEPFELDQSVFGAGVFINAHEGDIVLWASGTLAEGATGEDVEAKLKGLVCQESCIPYNQTVRSRGPGSDALFADFPTVSGSDDTDATPGGVPVPTRDEVLSGNADATLYTRVVDGRVRAALQIEIDAGWHLYNGPEKADLGHPDAIGKPTVIELHGAGLTWGPVHFPEPEEIDQSFVEEGVFILSHEGTVVLYAEGLPAGGAPGAPVASGEGIWGVARGQTCSDDLCIDYEEVFVSRGAGPDSVWDDFEATVVPVTVTAGGADAGSEGSLLLFLLAAIGGGLFALVMPCTYPMIPITISFFTKQADARGGNVLPLSLVYGAGIVLIFVLVGVVFGSLIIPFAAHPVTNLVIGLAFLYFALVLFGVVELRPPRFLMNVAGQASMRGGFLGVFLMGATLVVTSFTCTAPFVGAILGFGASEGGVGRVALGMAVFGLTMAIPFVFLSLVPGRVRAMPKSGEWMNTLKVTLGFVEVAAALKFFSNSDLVWEWNLLSREVFLLLWVLIFAAASLYLFGFLRFGKGRVEIGPRRKLAATALLLFSAYCGWGMVGNKLNKVMTAIVPNYSGGRAGWEWYSPGGSWAIVKDDYDGALEQARGEGKLVLTNFTGFT